MLNTFSVQLEMPNYAILAFALLLLLLAVAYYKYGERFDARFRAIVRRILAGVRSGEEDVEKVLGLAGYAYDAKQDIFYSTVDAWQRNFGYCRLYDEAAAPLNMIIDCEPIYFSYAGKRWMIELWKGQYALVTGCEIGVYNTTRPDITIPGIFTGPFFDCASDEEMLYISYTAKKHGKILFTRADKHWWVTGFVLAEFSEPAEIIMDVRITLKDEAMRDAFVSGLKAAGYRQNEMTIHENTVSLTFDKPRTIQPFTRTQITDWLIQRKNEYLCKKMQEAMKDNDATTADKLRKLEIQSPELYNSIRSLGRPKQLFDVFETIKNYLR